MPALPSANKVLKVTFKGTNQGTTKWNCIMHSLYAGNAPQASDIATFLTALEGDWSTNIAPLCATQVELTEVDGVDLSSPTSASNTISVAVAGTRVGNPLPAQVALVSSWHINLRYRGGHARNYWPGGVETDRVGGNQWNSAGLTAFAAAFSQFLTTWNATAIAGGSQSMVMLSYKTAHAFRPIPLTSAVTSVSVHPRIDTQRRRLGKEF